MTSETETDKQTTERTTPGPRSRWKVISAVLAVCVLGIALLWLESGFDSAQRSLRKRRFADARSAAERFLLIHPGHHEARMTAARAWVLDENLPALEGARNAITHLSQIPDDAANAAEARMLEGRLTFLILLRPTAAEALFRRALEIDPDQFDSHYMLWKLFDMTERYFDSEPHFREAYRLVPPQQKAVRLREWYLSQFSPLSSCAELDGMMGFRGLREPTSELVAFRRLTAFSNEEPESPMVAAAIAQSQLRNRERDAALQTLESIPDCDSVTNSYFVAALTEVLLELGQLERAQKVYQNWPQPADGYRYWRITGMVHQLAKGDYALAADFYEKALEDWPGPSDWLTMHRRFRCLALLGKKEAADAARKQSEAVEQLMELEDHQQQKEALGHLNDPDKLRQIITFYNSLGRPWEAQQWRDVVRALEEK